MKALTEGKRGASYSFKGSQLPHKASVIGAFRAAARRGAAGMKGYGSANIMQGYGQPAVANMSNMGTPMMGGGAMMSGYPSMASAQMSLPPQYSLQLPQVPNALPQGSMPNIQMYPANMSGASGAATVVTPAQLAALMKTPGVVAQPQMGNWPQFGGMQAISGYPSMSPYTPRPSASSFIVDYSDGLNILDEPTGGTTYMSK